MVGMVPVADLGEEFGVVFDHGGSVSEDKFEVGTATLQETVGEIGEGAEVGIGKRAVADFFQTRRKLDAAQRETAVEGALTDFLESRGELDKLQPRTLSESVIADFLDSFGDDYLGQSAEPPESGAADFVETTHGVNVEPEDLLLRGFQIAVKLFEFRFDDFSGQDFSHENYLL